MLRRWRDWTWHFQGHRILLPPSTFISVFVFLLVSFTSGRRVSGNSNAMNVAYDLICCRLSISARSFGSKFRTLNAKKKGRDRSSPWILFADAVNEQSLRLHVAFSAHFLICLFPFSFFLLISSLISLFLSFSLFFSLSRYYHFSRIERRQSMSSLSPKDTFDNLLFRLMMGYDKSVPR